MKTQIVLAVGVMLALVPFASGVEKPQASGEEKPQAAPAAPMVISIDELTATKQGSNTGGAQLIIKAKGTVPHPGFANPRLETVPVAAAPAGTLFLKFVTDAPPPDMVFPMVIAQVEATLTVPFSDQKKVSVAFQGDSKVVEVE